MVATVLAILIPLQFFSTRLNILLLNLLR